MYMGKFGIVIVFIIVIAVITAAVLWVLGFGNQGGSTVLPGASSTASNTTPTLVLATTTSTANSAGSVSDGTITFTVPTDFGVAVNQQQVPTNSYIPPCDPTFDYCLYYTGAAYQGTNFESAGIRIDKRPDLTSENTCLTTAPTGYSNFTPTSTTIGDYSISEFTPLGDAAAGHFSNGTLYRLFYSGACYEFETRIGQSDYGNYPAGTIKQFTSADESSLQSEIHNILDSVTLPSGETVNFPS